MIINNSGTTQDPSSNPDYSQQNTGRTDTGTGFTNIDQILNANTGAGQQMGSAINQGLTGLGSSVNNQANQDYNTFETGAQNALNPYYGSNGYFTQANQLVMPTQTVGESTADYNTALQNYYNTAANYNGTALNTLGQNVANAKYSGPTGITNAQQLQNQGTQIGGLQSISSTPAGQQQLLSNYVGGRGYTTGESALDQALLGGAGTSQINQGMQSLNNVPQNIANLTNAATNQANAYGTGLTAAGAQIGKNVSNSLNGAASAANGTTPANAGGILTQAQAANAASNTQIGILGQLLNGTITKGNYTQQDINILNNMPALLQQYGLTPQDAQALAYNNNMYIGENALTPQLNANTGINSTMLGDLAGSLQQQSPSNYLFNSAYNTGGGIGVPGGNNNQQLMAENLENFGAGAGAAGATQLANNQGVTQIGNVYNPAANGGAMQSLANASNTGAQNALNTYSAGLAAAGSNLTTGINNAYNASSNYYPSYTDPLTGYSTGALPANTSSNNGPWYNAALAGDQASYVQPMANITNGQTTLQDLINQQFGNNNYTLAQMNNPAFIGGGTAGGGQNRS